MSVSPFQWALTLSLTLSLAVPAVDLAALAVTPTRSTTTNQTTTTTTRSTQTYQAPRTIQPANSWSTQSEQTSQSFYPPDNGYSNNYGGGNGGFAPLQGRVVTAPAGTMMNLALSSSLSSETARVGDRYVATLSGDVASGGSVVLPAGTQMEAQVVSVTRAGRTGKPGELDLRFTSATLPNGQRIPMSGRLQTEDGSGILKGGSTGGRLGKAALATGVGAGLGAALGTAMGPLSGGRVGRGAIYGTVLGSGMGLAGAALQKGSDAVLPSGQPLNVILDQPLTVSFGSGYGSPSPYNAPPVYSQPGQSFPSGMPANGNSLPPINTAQPW